MGVRENISMNIIVKINNLTIKINYFIIFLMIPNFGTQNFIHTRPPPTYGNIL